MASQGAGLSPFGPMAVVFSGIKPTGEVHLGNYLGALRQWVAEQHRPDEAYYCVVDLHALTVPQDPDVLRERTQRLCQILLAIGLDPDVCTLFVQWHVHEHSELAWLIDCTASFGELSRMTQFKDKSDRTEFVSGGLFTYPSLMAADILLYDTTEVPVGDDQRQHIELTRTVAERFNHRYGDTFVVPEGVVPPVGARVMDLQSPTDKMSGSVEESTAGRIDLLDDPKSIEKKIKRAVTDTDNEVRYDVAAKPGVSNLLSILAACVGGDPETLSDDYELYGPLKADVAEAVVEVLRPVQQRYAELASDPGETQRLMTVGADRAREHARGTLSRAHHALGVR